MISTDLQPTSIVNDKGFQCFLKVIDPKYVPPSRRTITRNHLPMLYSTCKSQLMESLSKTEFCAVTTDIWTSRSTQSFLSVTAHYIDNEKSPCASKSCILETVCLKVDHTGENIAGQLLRVTEEWSLRNKVICAVTDSASNMNLAIRTTRWNHLPCFAHTLNLIVQGAIAADEQLSTLQAQCKKIVSFFHRSVKASDRLASVQNQLDLPANKLIQEVETRWNSTFYMFQRYLQQHNAITTTLCLLDRKDLCLNNTELLQDAVSLLAPFEAITTEISSEKYVSLSKIIPIVRSLHKLTVASKSKSALREKLIANTAHRFGTVESNHTLAAATFLDPRFKKLAFTQIPLANECEKHLLSEMGSVTLDDPREDVNDPPITNPDMSPASADDVWKYFDSKVIESRDTQTIQSECLVEIKQYLASNVIDRKNDPLQWWSDNKIMYKRLYVLASKYLCIPATSVPSERLFSKAGELISAKRSRLKEKNINTILFLNYNLS